MNIQGLLLSFARAQVMRMSLAERRNALFFVRLLTDYLLEERMDEARQLLSEAGASQALIDFVTVELWRDAPH